MATQERTPEYSFPTLQKEEEIRWELGNWTVSAANSHASGSYNNSLHMPEFPPLV